MSYSYQHYRHLDFSLRHTKTFTFEDKFCECKRCNGKFRLANWVDRNEKLWYNKEGACIYKLTFQLLRIAMAFGEDLPPHFLYTLQELAK